MRARLHSRTICWPLVAAIGLASAAAPALAAADLEVRKSVDNEVPNADEPLTFTVDVRNVGADTAHDVHVQDLLPAGLSIPAGLAAFPSSGSYDAATGDWSVGDLGAGASARLVIPAIVSNAQPPACLVNVAEASNANDPTPDNNRAVAAVRSIPDAHCVDVVAEVSSVQLGSTTCGTTNRFSAWIEVANRGPHVARDVVVDLAQNPTVAPELRFTTQLSGPPTSCSRTRCTLPSLAAGEAVSLLAESGSFSSTRPTPVTLTASVATTDYDYSTENNQHQRAFTVPGVDDCVVVGGTTDNGACVVVAALQGSRLERHVAALRGFRDRHLLRSAAGRVLVRSYYWSSPPLVRALQKHDILRSAVRGALAPVVLATAYPSRALAVFVLVVAACASAWLAAQRGRQSPKATLAGTGGTVPSRSAKRSASHWNHSPIVSRPVSRRSSKK